MTEFQLNFGNETIKYIHPLSEDGKSAVMVQNTIPSELETFGNLTQEEYEGQMFVISKLSKRNERQSYIVPIEQDVVLLNFIPQKTTINDLTQDYILNTEFEYFVNPNLNEDDPLPFSLVEGTFFRVVDGLVRDIQQYQYYVIIDSAIQQIPNFKTLEVLLSERGRTYDDVRVIEASEFNELIQSLGQPQ